MMHLAGLAAAIAVNLSFLVAARKGDTAAAAQHSEESGLYILEGEYEIRCGDQKVRRNGFVCFRSGELPHTLTPVSTWPSTVPGDASSAGLGGFWKEFIQAPQPLDINKVLEIAEKYNLEVQTL